MTNMRDILNSAMSSLPLPTTENSRGRRRTHEEQVAYDSGNGRRCISHHADNPYDAETSPALHWAYNEGFSDLNEELS